MSGTPSETYLPEGSNSALPRRPSGTAVLKCGIFYADQDIHIATRFRDYMQQKGCETNLFGFELAGVPKLEELENYISKRHILLWIATATSLNDDGILTAARHIAHYASITRPRMKIKYITVKPKEYKNIELPLLLDSYTSLIEDEWFAARLDKTLASIKMIFAETDERLAGRQFTATVNATTDDVTNRLRSAPPLDDVSETSDSLKAGSSKVSSISHVTHSTIINMYGPVRNLQIGDAAAQEEEQPVNTAIHTSSDDDDDDNDIFYPAQE